MKSHYCLGSVSLWVYVVHGGQSQALPSLRGTRLQLAPTNQNAFALHKVNT